MFEIFTVLLTFLCLNKCSNMFDMIRSSDDRKNKYWVTGSVVFLLVLTVIVNSIVVFNNFIINKMVVYFTYFVFSMWGESFLQSVQLYDELITGYSIIFILGYAFWDMHFG